MAVLRFLHNYVIIGATLGAIVVIQAWLPVLHGLTLPHGFGDAGAVAWHLLRPMGSGLLKMFAWLPSALYHLGFAHLSFQQWLFASW
jgi:hypothetical protein